MLRCTVNGVPALWPDEDEWRQLCDGSLTQAGGMPVQYVKGTQEAHRTERTVKFLVQLVPQRRILVPRVAYWDQGVPDLDQLNIPLALWVYFHRFHCFDCGVDVDGYALDHEAYSVTERNQIYRTRRFQRCPRCQGDLRNPGMIEIVRINF